MKIKCFFYQSSLVIFLLLSGVAFAQSLIVKFDDSRGSGIALNKVHLQKVAVETVDIYDEVIDRQFLNVLLKACPFKTGNSTYLMPIFSVIEPHCEAIKGANFSNSQIFGGGINLMYVSVDTYDPDVSSFREVIATYEFNEDKMNLTPVFLPTPRQIKISFDWEKMQWDFI